MYFRLFYLSLLLFLIIDSRLYGDTLQLINFDEEINVKIVDIEEEYVKVNIPQKEIESIKVKTEHGDKYPDAIFININGKESKIICKIMKVTERTGSITLKIPRQKISAIQMGFTGDEQYINSDQNEVSIAGKEDRKKDHPPVDTDKLKKQIKDELNFEFEKKQQEKEMVFEEKNFGKVICRMLYNGNPLPECQVKIVLLEKWGFYGTVKKGIQFETVTNKNGRCHFEKVLPGGYKLYWKPPTETSWIRYLEMEPDFYVETGETHYLPDTETNIRTLN